MTNFTLESCEQHYKMFIPQEVEKKIRTWCALLPDKEWSGVLFYSVNGNFEDNSLEVICKDMLVMNIGESAYTEFSYDEDVAFYMAQNPELLDCYQALIHSHNNMKAFFSGTDVNTILKEGSKTDNFVSLVVNNAGQYVAIVTRKVISNSCIKGKKTIHTLTKFFGESVEKNTTVEDAEVNSESNMVEYYPLDITIEKSSWDEEISRYSELKAKSYKPATPFYSPKSTILPKETTPFKSNNTWEPKLFEDDDNLELDATIQTYLSPKYDKAWKNAGLYNLINKIILGTPYTTKDIDLNVFKKTVDFDKDVCKYFSQQKNQKAAEEDFCIWVSDYLNYLIESFDVSKVSKDIPFDFEEEVLISKLITELEDIKSDYMQLIVEELKSRIDL